MDFYGCGVSTTRTHEDPVDRNSVTSTLVRSRLWPETLGLPDGLIVVEGEPVSETDPNSSLNRPTRVTGGFVSGGDGGLSRHEVSLPAPVSTVVRYGTRNLLVLGPHVPTIVTTGKLLLGKG